jgi:hypothetical protein
MRSVATPSSGAEPRPLPSRLPARSRRSRPARGPSWRASRRG